MPTPAAIGKIQQTQFAPTASSKTYHVWFKSRGIWEHVKLLQKGRGGGYHIPSITQKSDAPKGMIVDELQGVVYSTLTLRFRYIQRQHHSLPVVKSWFWLGPGKPSHSPSKSKLEVGHYRDKSWSEVTPSHTDQPVPG